MPRRMDPERYSIPITTTPSQAQKPGQIHDLVLPFAVTRYGLGHALLETLSNYSFKPTKFGRALDNALVALPGVWVVFDIDVPTVLRVVVKDEHDGSKIDHEEALAIIKAEVQKVTARFDTFRTNFINKLRKL